MIRIITDMIGGSAQSTQHLPKATMEQVSGAIANGRASVVELLHRCSIPAKLQASVWAFLIGVYPLENVDANIKEKYLVVKRQWVSVTESQLIRSHLLLDDVKRCTQYIDANRQQFISVVVAHPAVLTLAFNIFMAILRVYHFIDKHFDVLKHIFRVFLWMFVEDIDITPTHCIFVGPGGIRYDQDTLEALMFWSIIYIFEGGETRRLLEISNPADHDTTEAISDFVFLVYPSMFRHLNTIGVKNFDRLIPSIIGHFSTFLPLCDCIDLWLAAAASPSFLDFTQFMLVSCLVLNFPNLFLSHSVPDQDLQPIIEQAFEYIDHRYLERASFILGERAREMVAQRIAQGGDL
jgi:hypothetical protein